MRKIYFLLTCWILLTFNVQAQKEIKSQADKAYSKMSYLKAVELYQQLDAEGLDAASKLKLANSFRMNGDTESAEYWYNQAAKVTKNSLDKLHYAQVLQSNGKCEEAINWYIEYLKEVDTPNQLPRAGLRDCDLLKIEAIEATLVRNVRELNSKHLEYSPVPYQDGLIFTSTKGIENKKLEDQWTKDYFSNLFFASKSADQVFNTPKPLAGLVNSDFHDGVATFNQAGTLMYFSRNNTAKNSKEIIDLNIYSAVLRDSTWQDITELPFNNLEFTSCHPSLSSDEKVLYFASNRPGGFGGMDIYRSIRKGTTWAIPENLGPNINTAGNEIFPFIAASGELYFASDGLVGIGGLDIYKTTLTTKGWSISKNLGSPINSEKDDFGFSALTHGKEGYFSSNRIGGFGGDDIYHWAVQQTDTEEVAQNSIIIKGEREDEFIKDVEITIIEGIHNTPNGQNVQLVSNETSLKKDPSSSIYITNEEGKIQPLLSMNKTYTLFIKKNGYTPVRKVVNSKDFKLSENIILYKEEGIFLKGLVMNKTYNHIIPNTNLELFNLCTGEYERIKSDESGKFEFFLKCNCDYELEVKKDRFSIDKKGYSTVNIDCNKVKILNTTFFLELEKNAKTENNEDVLEEKNKKYRVGQIIELENLYYDFNETDMSEQATNALDKIADLLKKYPRMEIQLGSHTDARGEEQYNQRLSQKRAEAAVNYILTKGIAANRVKGKGFGETQLKNHCKDGVDCNDAEHQENRRTVITITKLDAEVEVIYKNE